MLNLKTLKFSGIGRFVEEQTIDFTSLGNLVQVDGQNSNTGGSSGAGKSTVFNALDFLLGINDLPNTVLQSRVTKNGISVVGEFDWDGKPVTIKRTKKGLSVQIADDVPIEGSSKLAEEKLDEILAIPRHLFRHLIHKRQGEGGFFLNLTPKQVHEFLTDILNLDGYRVKIQNEEKKITELTDRKTKTQNIISNNQATIAATQNALASLGALPAQEVTRESILELKKISEQAERDMQLLLQAHAEESTALAATRPQVTIKPFDRSYIERLETELRALTDKAEALSVGEQARQTEVSKQLTAVKIEKMKLETAVSQGTKAHQEAVTVASEIKRIRDSQCPTCEQHWATEGAKRKEQALLTKVKELKEIVAIGTKAAEDLVVVKLKLADLEPQLLPKKIDGLDVLLAEKDRINADLSAGRAQEKAHQGSEVAKSRAVMDEFNQKAYALTNRQNGEAQHVRAQFDIARRAFDIAVNKMKLYEDTKKRHEANKQSLENSLTEPMRKSEELTALLAGLEEELALAEEAKKLIKSFMSRLFDSSLEYISEVATKMVRSVPNMANATIQLEGVKETKAGVIKEEVNAVINLDGEESIPIKSLSGGERTTVDLGVDFAVIDLIENETNKGTDIFVLDEPFNGLDTVCVEMALELLRNSNINKKVIIVDHNPEVKQMVQSRLLAIRTGATSVISQS